MGHHPLRRALAYLTAGLDLAWAGCLISGAMDSPRFATLLALLPAWAWAAAFVAVAGLIANPRGAPWARYFGLTLSCALWIGWSAGFAHSTLVAGMTLLPTMLLIIYVAAAQLLWISAPRPKNGTGGRGE